MLLLFLIAYVQYFESKPLLSLPWIFLSNGSQRPVTAEDVNDVGCSPCQINKELFGHTVCSRVLRRELQCQGTPCQCPLREELLLVITFPL